MEYNIERCGSLHAVLDHSSDGLRNRRTEDDSLNDKAPWSRRIEQALAIDIIFPSPNLCLSSLHAVHSGVGLHDRRQHAVPAIGALQALQDRAGPKVQLGSTTVATSN